MPQEMPQEMPPEMPQEMKVDTQEEVATPSFDFSFPVVVEDGRHLIISWNHGDDPQQVATSFTTEHGIPMEEVPTIVAFVQEAQRPRQEQTPQEMEVDTQEDVTPPSFDFSFPVNVEDGRRLIISWNHGDEPQQVATSFTTEHGIPIEEVPTIVAFVQDIATMHAMKLAQAEEAPPAL